MSVCPCVYVCRSRASAQQVTEWNRMVANITGYSKSEALGKDLVNNFISEQYKELCRASAPRGSFQRGILLWQQQGAFVFEHPNMGARKQTWTIFVVPVATSVL